MAASSELSKLLSKNGSLEEIEAAMKKEKDAAIPIVERFLLKDFDDAEKRHLQLLVSSLFMQRFKQKALPTYDKIFIKGPLNARMAAVTDLKRTPLKGVHPEFLKSQAVRVLMDLQMPGAWNDTLAKTAALGIRQVFKLKPKDVPKLPKSVLDGTW